MGKTIKRKGNVRKTRKHLKRKRGGNPDRIEKLKEIVEYYLQYIYYKYFLHAMRILCI